jgi:hypothetical protein
MPYDLTRDPRRNLRTEQVDPASRVEALTTAAVSDASDLPVYPKALRVWNGSLSAVTLMVTPARAPSDTTAVPITIPAGGLTIEPISVRRIWATGSTGLLAGLASGEVEVLLLLE